jgi:hypothetical protein
MLLFPLPTEELVEVIFDPVIIGLVEPDEFPIGLNLILMITDPLAV